MNGGRSRVFAIETRSSRATPCLLFSMSSLWSPCSVGIGGERTNPALRGVPFADPLSARVSAFADDIIVFVSRRLDIKAVKNVVGE